MGLGCFVIWGIYVIGMKKYAASKGYNFWIAFWLSFVSWPGLIVLFLLKDLNAKPDPAPDERT